MMTSPMSDEHAAISTAVTTLHFGYIYSWCDDANFLMKSFIQEESKCSDEDKCMGAKCGNDDKVEEEQEVPVFAIEPSSGIKGQAGSVGIL